MPNYLLVAQGVLQTSFPWSFRCYGTAAGTESAVEAAWHTALNSFFTNAGVLPLIPTSTIWTGDYVSTMDASWKQTTKTSQTANVAGTGVQALPPHTSICVTLRSSSATKYGRGRIYLPTMAAAAMAAGGSVLSASAIAALNTGLNAWLTGLRGTVTLVVLHRRGTKTGPGPLTTSNVVTADFGNEFTTQRRRADKFAITRTSLVV